jgi:hypothetical protein
MEMINRNALKTRVLSSLEKVFADEELRAPEWKSGTMLNNETYSFQVAYHWDNYMLKNVKVEVRSELAPHITIYSVGLVPSDMPCYWDHDDNVLRTTPGLYPDPLLKTSREGITLLPKQWRSLWVKISPEGQAKAGTYPIEIIFRSGEGEELGKAVFSLKLSEMALPPQSLIHTSWFHTDCIATYYGLEVFSEEHWERIGQYLETAVKYGINMILTPLFTPPLDTEVGGERPTVQLVGVEKVNDQYHFNFDKLERWVSLCLEKGVQYFELSHLFTQWGAKHAPKIMATENGEYKRIFGWDTDAAGPAYRNFLEQFLPELLKFIEAKGLEERVYFHVSDEPHMSDIESYRAASGIIRELVQGYPIIDALSNYEFYEAGLVPNPIPSNDHIEDFLENGVEKLWTYYCCGQYKKVANRFFNMPSARSRILGMQLYKFDIHGFLQWGYNFWYSQYSKYPIDPFKVTDAAQAFPSGDPFSVYPGADSPIVSLRLQVFYEALQDLRALKLLESHIGREKVIELLEEDLDKPITFSEYPTDAEWLLKKREKINRLLQNYC